MNKIGSFIINVGIRVFSPVLLWVYRPAWHRKFIIRTILITVLTPLIGLVRRPYVNRQFRKQLETQIQQKQSQLKQSLENIDFDIKNVEADYIVVIKSSPKKYDEQMLYSYQKILFQLNREISEKLGIDQTYFEDIKFIFLGQKKIYQVVDNNPSNSNMKNQFKLIQYCEEKGQKNREKTSKNIIQNENRIYLISKQADGKQKILLEFQYNTKLQAILRQISKNKHKKYLQSMNF